MVWINNKILWSDFYESWNEKAIFNLINIKRITIKQLQLVILVRVHAYNLVILEIDLYSMYVYSYSCSDNLFNMISLIKGFIMQI